MGLKFSVGLNEEIEAFKLSLGAGVRRSESAASRCCGVASLMCERRITNRGDMVTKMTKPRMSGAFIVRECNHEGKEFVDVAALVKF